jgi:hypothetical protein
VHHLNFSVITSSCGISFSFLTINIHPSSDICFNTNYILPIRLAVSDNGFRFSIISGEKKYFGTITDRTNYCLPTVLLSHVFFVNCFCIVLLFYRPFLNPFLPPDSPIKPYCNFINRIQVICSA